MTTAISTPGTFFSMQDIDSTISNVKRNWDLQSERKEQVSPDCELVVRNAGSMLEYKITYPGGNVTGGPYQLRFLENMFWTMRLQAQLLIEELAKKNKEDGAR